MKWKERGRKELDSNLYYETCLEGLSKTAYNSVMGVHVPGEMQTETF